MRTCKRLLFLAALLAPAVAVAGPYPFQLRAHGHTGPADGGVLGNPHITRSTFFQAGSTSALSIAFATDTRTGFYLDQSSPPATALVAVSSGVVLWSVIYSTAASPASMSPRMYIGGLPQYGSAAPSDRLVVYNNTDGTGSTNVESCDLYAMNDGSGSARVGVYAAYASNPVTEFLGAWGTAKAGNYYSGGPALARAAFVQNQAGANWVFQNDSAQYTYFLTSQANAGWLFSEIDAGSPQTALFVSTTGCQIRGTTTNDSANAGFVGEYLASSTTFINTAASTHYEDVATITLTPGDWDVSAAETLELNTGSGLTSWVGGVSDFSGDTSNNLHYGDSAFSGAIPTSANNASIAYPSTQWRVPIGTTKPLYLKNSVTCTSGQPKIAGTIQARRIR